MAPQIVIIIHFYFTIMAKLADAAWLTLVAAAGRPAHRFINHQPSTAGPAAYALLAWPGNLRVQKLLS